MPPQDDIDQIERNFDLLVDRFRSLNRALEGLPAGEQKRQITEALDQTLGQAEAARGDIAGNLSLVEAEDTQTRGQGAFHILTALGVINAHVDYLDAAVDPCGWSRGCAETDKESHEPSEGGREHNRKRYLAVARQPHDAPGLEHLWRAQRRRAMAEWFSQVGLHIRSMRELVPSTTRE